MQPFHVAQVGIAGKGKVAGDLADKTQTMDVVDVAAPTDGKVADQGVATAIGIDKGIDFSLTGEYEVTDGTIVVAYHPELGDGTAFGWIVGNGQCTIDACIPCRTNGIAIAEGCIICDEDVLTDAVQII